jgi:hypothetical protein
VEVLIFGFPRKTKVAKPFTLLVAALVTQPAGYVFF